MIFSLLPSIFCRLRSVCCVSLIMTKPTILFQYVKSTYQIMGIYPSQSNRDCSFNIKIFCITSSMMFVAIASIAYLLFDTQSVMEFGWCFNSVVALLVMLLNFFVQLSKMPKIRRLVQNFEAFIKKSE